MARVHPTRVQDWVELARQSAYDADALSRQLKVSRRQLQRYTGSAFGCSPQKWLNEQRLILAVQLLKDSLSVKEVSALLGFKQVSHFSREFRRQHGLGPKEFLAANGKLHHPASSELLKNPVTRDKMQNVRAR